MSEFEINTKLDYNKLNEMIGGEDQSILRRLDEMMNQRSERQNSTYKSFFQYLCPQLNFQSIDNICNTFFERIKSELCFVQIFNVIFFNLV